MKEFIVLVVLSGIVLLPKNQALSQTGIDSAPDIVVADPSTYISPQVIYLHELDDRAVKIYIVNERTEYFELSSLRVHGRIPAYTPELYPTIDEEDRIVTDCFVYRFLSVYRPIKAPMDTTYTVTYIYGDWTPFELKGDVTIDFYEGDINLDGLVDGRDLEFLAAYLFQKGKACLLEELMDIDKDDDYDMEDLMALRELIS
jgi:hypothetical protein